MLHRETVDEPATVDRVYEQEVVDDRATTGTSWVSRTSLG